MSMSMQSETSRTLQYPGDVEPSRAGAIEPWFAILLSALVPLLAALFVPPAWRPFLHVAGGLLCVAGLVLLIRHEMEIRQQRNVTDRQ
jgi:hypothetical protein